MKDWEGRGLAPILCQERVPDALLSLLFPQLAISPNPMGINMIEETYITIPQALGEAAKRDPEGLAFVYLNEEWSFRRFESSTDHLARSLLELGLKSGDRIGLLALNQIQWLQVFFAATRLGIAVVGINARYRDSEIHHMLVDSEITAVFTLSELDGFNYLEMFERIGPATKLKHLIPLDAPAFNQIAPSRSESTDPPPPAKPDDVAMVIYTSGTTGTPKGCALTHRSLLAAATAQARHMALERDDFLQLAVPLNHVGGLSCCMLPLLIAGGACELVPVFKAGPVIERINERPPTLIIGVPTMMSMLLSHPSSDSADFSRVRLVANGGTSLVPAIFEQLQKLMPNASFMNLYGLTEVSGMISGTQIGCPVQDLMDTVGSVFPGAEVKICDQDGIEVDDGTIGELHVRGLGVVSDYIGAAAGSAAFEGGWFKTGDLGMINDRGLIKLQGRMKDMFIQGGYNVYPAEVEALVGTHPGVLMCAGIGVSDPVMGEVGKYFVVPKTGVSLVAEDMISYCKGKIADYKVPRIVEIRDSLPLTPAGKIQKSLIRPS